MRLKKNYFRQCAGFMPVLFLALGLARGAWADTLSVNTTADSIDAAGSCGSGVCSLRDAIAQAGAGDTVDATGVAGTITLLNGELTIGQDLTITGPGEAVLAVSGNNASRVFEISAGAAAVSGITVTGGNESATLQHGGGIVIDASASLNLSDVTLSGNSGYFGGALNTGLNSTLNLTNCTISGNSSRVGGGIFNGGNCSVTDSTFSNNATPGIGGIGGGISNEGNMTLSGCTLNGNSTSYMAGAIYNANLTSGQALTMTNCTIAGNSAGTSYGAMLSSNYSLATVTNCTFTGNSAGTSVGGIFTGNGSPFQLLNTLVIGNSAPTDPDVQGPFDGSGTVGNNLIGNIGDATGFSSANHDQFGVSQAPISLASVLQTSGGAAQLTNNGGPTETVALVANSLAIDAGNDAVLSAPYNLATDQRGEPRLAAQHVDIGAFETQIPLAAQAQNLGMAENASLPITLVAKFGIGAISYTIGTAPSEGVLSAIDGNQVTYTPNTGFAGNDGFQFTATDADDNVSTATVSITVNEPISLVVTTTADIVANDGLTSLREAIAYANSGNAGANPTITFAIPNTDANYNGGAPIINLIGNTFLISASMTIDSQGTSVTINGSNAFNIFSIVDGTVDIKGLILTGCKNDGAINVTISAILNLSDSTLSGNTSVASNNTLEGAGGAIYNNEGVINIDNCTFSGNSAEYGGAIFNGGTLTIGNSTFSGNQSDFGGAIYNEPASGTVSVSIANTTFSGNSATIGGAIVNDAADYNADLTLVNCTVSGNSASTSTGGVVNKNDGSTAWLLNTIVAGNTAPTDPDVQGAFDLSGTVGNNLIGDTGDATGFSAANHDLFGSNANPLSAGLDPNGLRNNGGPTSTIALIPGSPAIDAGYDTTQAPYNLTTDQRGAGFPREIGSHVDIGAYEFQTPTPTISGFSPTSGPVGTAVAITGTNLIDIATGKSTVVFGGITATQVTVVSATQLTAVVPQGALTGVISVTTTAGTASSAGQFTVAAKPAITSINPTSGAIGSSVIVAGTNFTNATTRPTVKLGTVTAVITAITATSATVTVPAGAITARISLTTPGGTASSAGNFTVVAKPAITSINPVSGAVGASVVIAGTNFTNATTAKPTVKFGTVAAAVTVVTATSATVTVPTGAVTGKISLTTTGGTASSAGNFTVVAKPSITSINPVSGAVGASVVIAGANFTNVTTAKPTVKFGTVAAAVSVLTATSATVTVPTGAVTGKISLTTTGGTASSAGSFTIVGKPTITAFSPGNGAVGAKVTITGTNLTNATTPKPSVLFGAKAASVVSATATTVVAIVPAGAGAGKIAVTTTGGTATSAASFAVTVAASLTEAPAASSAVILSAANASASSDGITLTFTNALDSDSAIDSSHYSVTVNGIAIEIASAGYRHGAVTLGLADDALRHGDVIAVAWSGLLDARGDALAERRVTVVAGR